MSVKNHHSNRPLRSAGAALVEFALVVPVLLILTVGTIQIGSIILSSHRMYQVAYEGARLASKTKGLELGTGQQRGVSCTSVSNAVFLSSGRLSTVVATNPAACPGESALYPAVSTQLKAIHDRTNVMLALERITMNSSPKWQTRVEYNSASHEVIVSIKANPVILLGYSNYSIPLSVSASLPYLGD